jgi:hypothetical protein
LPILYSGLVCSQVPINNEAHASDEEGSSNFDVALLR